MCKLAQIKANTVTQTSSVASENCSFMAAIVADGGRQAGFFCLVQIR